jgi:hypothetical protein
MLKHLKLVSMDKHNLGRAKNYFHKIQTKDIEKV